MTMPTSHHKSLFLKENYYLFSRVIRSEIYPPGIWSSLIGKETTSVKNLYLCDFRVLWPLGKNHGAISITSFCPKAAVFVLFCFNFNMQQKRPEGLLRHRLLGHTPRVSDSVGWGVRIFVSNKFKMVMLMVWGPRFEKHCLKTRNLSYPNN